MVPLSILMRFTPSRMWSTLAPVLKTSSMKRLIEINGMLIAAGETDLETLDLFLQLILFMSWYILPMEIDLF